MVQCPEAQNIMISVDRAVGPWCVFMFSDFLFVNCQFVSSYLFKSS